MKTTNGKILAHFLLQFQLASSLRFVYTLNARQFKLKTFSLIKDGTRTHHKKKKRPFNIASFHVTEEEEQMEKKKKKMKKRPEAENGESETEIAANSGENKGRFIMTGLLHTGVYHELCKDRLHLEQ